TARSGHHIPRWDGRHENQTVGYSRRARNGPIALAEKVERGPTDHEDDIIDVSQALDDWLDMSGWPRAALPEHDERIGRKSQLLFERRRSAGRRCGQGGNVANDVDAARLAITRLELARDFISDCDDFRCLPETESLKVFQGPFPQGCVGNVASGLGIPSHVLRGPLVKIANDVSASHATRG